MHTILSWLFSFFIITARHRPFKLPRLFILFPHLGLGTLHRLLKRACSARLDALGPYSYNHRGGLRTTTMFPFRSRLKIISSSHPSRTSSLSGRCTHCSFQMWPIYYVHASSSSFSVRFLPIPQCHFTFIWHTTGAFHYLIYLSS